MKNNRADFDKIFNELERAGLRPEILSRDPKGCIYTGITSDSRRLGASDIFCAIKGSTFDGHSLVSSALSVAKLAIIEHGDISPATLRGGVIKVTSTRAAWAQIASFFADHPAEKLKMVGVTGTNGKTSTTWLLKEIFSASGMRSGSIGTLGFFAGEEHIESAHTTPDPDVLYPTLASFVTKGITHVVMEVSSHSLVQGKIWPIRFDACAFTSFSQDHLDFHSSMEEYLAAKLSLFSRHLKPQGFCLVHTGVLHWPTAKITFSSLRQGYCTYGGSKDSADYQIRSESFFSQGFSRVNIRSQTQNASVTLPMVGDVFCENFSAALILAELFTKNGLSELSSKIATAHIRPVPGRLELIRAQSKPWRPPVYVDYAHTPDAVEKAILNLSSKPRSISTVFGCGGDRDRKKRPIMGAIAAKLSKTTWITSDNPRSEDPEEIINEIISGVNDQSNVKRNADRRAAISESILSSAAQQPVLIAGKGHESYQIIGTDKLPFSDQKEALSCLSRQKSWLIVGAGLTGLSAAKLLLDADERVLIYADNPVQLPRELAGKARVLTQDEIKKENFDTIVASPGVPTDHPVLASSRLLGKEIITEIDLGLDRYRGTIIAVTGTNGKSTTVSMAEFLLRSKNLRGDACGNIGIPPTSIPLWQMPDNHFAILELSSYQLEGAALWPARAAAITSFSFDHISRHKTMNAYFEAKWKITSWLGRDSLFIVSQEVADFALKYQRGWPSCHTIIVCKNSDLVNAPAHAERAIITDGHLKFGDWMLDFEQLGVFGEHNYVNAFAAIMLVSHSAGLSPQELAPMLRQYKGLPYRCERIFDDGHRIIVNDSKSTNLESTLAAMSLATRPSILMMGGQGKGEPYEDLCGVKDRISVLITFGASANEIAAQSPSGVRVESFEKMAAAVLRALDLARENKWDIIFSPGCASFDEFKNFEHRGAVFSQMVRDYQ